MGYTPQKSTPQKSCSPCWRSKTSKVNSQQKSINTFKPITKLANPLTLSNEQENPKTSKTKTNEEIVADWLAAGGPPAMGRR
ncbi:hypothetical protein DdX_12624 [Ditylenchus destructor]|uniref:Uncharacterized protein n=1 Tax=Ditylenchus destructor TaxID=166010 RepID=A0AAD4N090_9BILA|nr:hypothetical protein DdX_12624 [Ditylenchus destructor]